MISNLGPDIEVYPVPPSIRLAGPMMTFLLKPDRVVGGHCLELPRDPFDRIRTEGCPLLTRLSRGDPFDVGIVYIRSMLEFLRSNGTCP